MTNSPKDLNLTAQRVLGASPGSEADLPGELAETSPGHNGQHVDAVVLLLVAALGRLILDSNGLADQMVEEVGVLLLRGDVAGVEQDGEAQGLEVVHVGGPGRVVELHLERVPGVVGQRQDLRGQTVARGWVREGMGM